MTNPWEIYDLIQDQLASDAVIEELLIGLTWTLCRSQGIGLAMSPTIPTRTLPWSGNMVGQKASKLVPWLRSWDPYEATVGMAAANSVINHDSALIANAVALRPSGAPNLAVFEHFLPRLYGKRVVVIGHYPGIETFARDAEWTVLERNPHQGDLPDQASEYLLREADWVFLTASSITNKTFPRLAELSRDANLVLMGPTVPWLPELSEFGVDYLAGARVHDVDALCRTVAEGGGTRIFETSVNYHVVDLGSREMTWVKLAIGDLVTERERLKQEMDYWYRTPKQGRFPKWKELKEVDEELSLLDLRFKRMWDARHSMQPRMQLAAS